MVDEARPRGSGRAGEGRTARAGSRGEGVARGETDADIATHLAVRESTAKAHVSRILTALDVTDRVRAALLARGAGL